MAGPIARVNTKLTAIDLDISRKLNWGQGVWMKFKIPDPDDATKLHTELTLFKGFDRLAGEEATRGDGREVIFLIADVAGTINSIIRLNDLMIEVGTDASSELFSIDTVPDIGPNEPLVYRVTCKTRTTRNKYFNV